MMRSASCPSGQPKTTLILSDEERRQLESLARQSRTAALLARRTRIVLASADGADNGALAKRLGLSPTTVCKWRTRFVRDRIDGLYDAPHPGAPRTVTDDQVERVIVRTLETTPRGAIAASTPLEAAIQAFLDAHNEAPKPFVWTKSADDILASIGRFAQRTLDTHARDL